jgi:hypothetical protein
MPVFLRRLSLGLLLIAATSAVLLLSDLGSRREASARTRAEAGRQVSIALLQHASQPILDDGREGMVKGLAEMGVTRDLFAKIIQGAMVDHCHKTNPRIATAEEYEAILAESL